MNLEPCDSQADFLWIVIEKSDWAQTAGGMELIGDADPGASRSDQENAIVAIEISLAYNRALIEQTAGGAGCSRTGGGEQQFQ